MVKNQYSMQYFTIPFADIDNKIPAGKLREKYAYSTTDVDEQGEPVNVDNNEPTWREALNHRNGNALNNTRMYQGVKYLVIADVFSHLKGETSHAISLGDSESAPNYTMFTIQELSSFE